MTIVIASRMRFGLALLAVVAGPLNAGAGEPARVAAAWAAGPMEVRVAIEGTLPAATAAALVGRSITFDDPRGAYRGDRRCRLRIAAARLEDHWRTLVVTTDPHPFQADYVLEIPGPSRDRPLVVRYDLSGVEASWDDGHDDPAPDWSGWLPTPDPTDLGRLARLSAGHARGLAAVAKPGRLAVETLMIVPRGEGPLHVHADVPVEATVNGEPVEERSSDGTLVARIAPTGEPVLLSMSVKTGESSRNGPPRVGVDVGGAGPSARFLLPWVPSTPPEPAPLSVAPELYSGGDPAKGATVFAGAEAKCATCHKFRGQGTEVGPDLSDLSKRDPREVYRDIAEPSARIHPGYVPYVVATKEGRVLAGTVRAEGADAIRVIDTEAKATVIPRAAIDQLRASGTSIMPVGLAGALGPERLRDLIAFLTAPPPTGPAGPPKP